MISSLCDIGILLDLSRADECRRLAQQLTLPLIADNDKITDFPLLLVYTDNGLVVVQSGPKAPGPVLVDFVSGAANYRRHKGGGELIVKAVGGSKQQRPTVVDATAGLGRDSFVLASWGYQVLMCERSAVVAALLADGLARAADCDDSDVGEVIQRMQLQAQDAVTYLQSLSAERRPDVVLIDPMFPESNKSALVKKEMRAFQQLIGPDTDSELLLHTALAAARHRVVVKRPRKAQPLVSKPPNFTVAGKAIRFDVYTIKAFEKA